MEVGNVLCTSAAAQSVPLPKHQLHGSLIPPMNPTPASGSSGMPHSTRHTGHLSVFFTACHLWSLTSLFPEAALLSVTRMYEHRPFPFSGTPLPMTYLSLTRLVPSPVCYSHPGSVTHLPDACPMSPIRLPVLSHPALSLSAACPSPVTHPPTQIPSQAPAGPCVTRRPITWQKRT